MSLFPPVIATPADVGLLMQLGVDGVFVGSGIFKSDRPQKRARAMVQAVTHFSDAAVLAKVSEDLGVAMVRQFPLYKVIHFLNFEFLHYETNNVLYSI